MHVLLTVELDQAISDGAREMFCNKMLEQGWGKLSLTTTFRAKFDQAATRTGALAASRGDVERAAQAAGVETYDVAAHCGIEQPAVWSNDYLG